MILNIVKNNLNACDIAEYVKEIFNSSEVNIKMTTEYLLILK